MGIPFATAADRCYALLIVAQQRIQQSIRVQLLEAS
jgi:hypothetical protein